jgi:light-regulated signal transduction histidine kinase (bacteriophytochrome)
MQELINDVLSYSRTVYEDRRPAGMADLGESLSRALETLSSRITDAGATVTAGDLPTVAGDTVQLALVFQNLLSNSLKYHRANVAPEIHVSGEAKGDEWIIRVRDNGIGFKQEYAQRIFGLFKRLHKDEYPGTGLGLAICQRIVERYGGRMWAEGRPDEGATFYFALPKKSLDQRS